MDGNWGEIARLKFIPRVAVEEEDADDTEFHTDEAASNRNGQWVVISDEPAEEADEPAAEEEQQLRVRRAIHEEYKALIAHILDRIDGNDRLDTTSFVSTVADFVGSSCVGYHGRNSITNEDVMWTMLSLAELHQWKQELKKQLRRLQNNGTDGQDTTDGVLQTNNENDETTTIKIQRIQESYNACQHRIGSIQKGDASEGPGGLMERPGLHAALTILRAGLKPSSLSQIAAWRDAVMNVLKTSSTVMEDLHWEYGNAHLRRRNGLEESIDDENPSKDDRSNNDPWIDASWLVLDSIALLHEIRPIGLPNSTVNQDLMGASSSTHEKHNNPQEDASSSRIMRQIVSTIAPIAGDGTYDLFLDLILFHPHHSACGGLSQRGVSRMQAPAAMASSLGHDAAPWSDWVELKLAVLRIAVGGRSGEGIFGLRESSSSSKEGNVDGGANDGTDDGTSVDNAHDNGAAHGLVLLVLSSSSKRRWFSQDAHTRKLETAVRSYLEPYLDGRGGRPSYGSLLQHGASGSGSRMKKKNAHNKSNSGGKAVAKPQSAGRTTEAMANAMTELLCLVLGDERANGVLRMHERSWGCTDSRCGSSLVSSMHALLITTEADESTVAGAGVAASADSVRPPLLPRSSCNVFNFVVDQLYTQHDLMYKISPPEQKMALLVDLSLSAAQLVLQLYEPNSALRQSRLIQYGWGDGSGSADGPPASAARMLRALAGWLHEMSSCHATKKNPQERCRDLYSPSWIKETCQKTLDISMTFLQSDVLPALGGSAVTPPQGGDGLGGGMGQHVDEEYEDHHPRADEAVPYRIRGRLMAQQRVQRLRKARLVPPPEIRRCCIEIIQDMVRHVGPLLPKLANNNGDANLEGLQHTFSFDLPILLLSYLTVDQALSPHIGIALENTLQAYKCATERYQRSVGSTNQSADFLVQSAAPVLPAILTASTSESHLARRFAARWTLEVVRCLDPDAARVLCLYLVTDSDKATSDAASACIKLIEIEEHNDSKDKGCSSRVGGIDGAALFMDSASGIDKDILYAQLDQEIDILAKELQIPGDAALILLQQHQFSRSLVIDNIRLCDSLDQVLNRCGVQWRCRSLLSENSTSDGSTNTGSLAAGPHQCGICYDDDFSNEEMHALPCGHMFCRSCFCSFLRVKFEDPRSLLGTSCPEQGCNERVAESDLKELEPEKLDIWKKHLFESFVDASEGHRWCPGVDCSMVAVSDSRTGSATCTSCKSSFCFKCGAEPHALADCSDVEDFMRLFKSSEYWIKKHAKPCPGPGCKVPIEKNQGCNHMTCSSCNTHFCWICLTIIGNDGNLNKHVCNRFDPRTEWSEKRRNEFYLSRFEACADGEKFAAIKVDCLATMLDDLADTHLPFSMEDFEILKKAREELVHVRSFLKWTYVIAWAWSPGNAFGATTPASGDLASSCEASAKRDLFESHQATLEMFTEKLARLTEMSLEEMYSTRGERYFRMHFRALAFHTQVLEKYVDRMVEFLARSRN